MPQVTTSTVVTPAVQTYFDKKLRIRAKPFMAHAKVAQTRPLKQRVGNTILFRQFPSLALALAPLVEGSPPTGKKLSATDITAQIQQWGDYVTLTDLVRATVESPILQEANDLLGEQSGQSIDALLRDVAAAGTSVVYGGAVSARSSLTTTTHKVDGALLDRMERFLLEQNARYFTEIVTASSSVSTFGIEPAFIAIIHPDVYFTLKEIPGFKKVVEYAAAGKAMKGEVGAYSMLRFLMSTQAKYYAGGGGSASGDVKDTGGNADVGTIIAFGKEAIATIPLDGMSMENVIKPLGSAGSADPLNQKSTSGWKHTGARKILDDNFMIRAEVTVAKNTP